MTEPITLNLTLEELKMIDKYVELNKETHELFDKIKSAYPQPRMTLESAVEGEVVSYNDEIYYRLEYPTAVIWYKRKGNIAVDASGVKLVCVTDLETHRLLEGLWFNDVRKGKYGEPYCPDEPEYDEVEWDEKDNPKPRSPLDEIVDEMVKEQQAQKLYNRLYDELGYDFDTCENIVDLVEDWIVDEQSSAGSQNVNTELLVDGFNDCVRKMKGMLR